MRRRAGWGWVRSKATAGTTTFHARRGRSDRGAVVEQPEHPGADRARDSCDEQERQRHERDAGRHQHRGLHADDGVDDDEADGEEEGR